MNTESIIYLTDAVLITAVVPTGRADSILKVVRELGVAGGIVHMAQGTGARERLGLLGIAVESEKEVVSLVVAAGHQDLIAEAIYRTGNLGVLGGGYLYISPLERVATYIPEQARERLAHQLPSGSGIVSAIPVTAALRIQILLPDDGTDRRLLRHLLQEYGITRGDSCSVRSVGMLQRSKTRDGRLPEPELARLVTLVVDEEKSGQVFDCVCEKANIGRPGGGMVLMDRLLGSTAAELPADVPFEPD